DLRDGHYHNLSHKWGVEGPTDDPAIVETRDRLRRAMMATVLFSQGTPMILMGDEVGRTQGGNNNGYCQDNEINWLRWEDRSERDEAFLEFVSRLIAIRREHLLLRQTRFLHEGKTPNGDPEIQWLRPDGGEMESGDWENRGTRALMVMLNGEEESLL